MADFIEYKVDDYRFRARVVTRHRDSSITVEPFHLLDANGNPRGCFIGGRIRLWRDDCVPA